MASASACSLRLGLSSSLFLLWASTAATVNPRFKAADECLQTIMSHATKYERAVMARQALHMEAAASAAQHAATADKTSREPKRLANATIQAVVEPGAYDPHHSKHKPAHRPSQKYANKHDDDAAPPRHEDNIHDDSRDILVHRPYQQHANRYDDRAPPRYPQDAHDTQDDHYHSYDGAFPHYAQDVHHDYYHSSDEAAPHTLPDNYYSSYDDHRHGYGPAHAYPPHDSYDTASAYPPPNYGYVHKPINWAYPPVYHRPCPKPPVNPQTPSKGELEASATVEVVQQTDVSRKQTQTVTIASYELSVKGASPGILSAWQRQQQQQQGLREAPVGSVEEDGPYGYWLFTAFTSIPIVPRPGQTPLEFINVTTDATSLTYTVKGRLVPAAVTQDAAPGDASAVVDYLLQVFLSGQPVPRDSSFLGFGRIPEPILQTKVDFSDPSRSCTYAAGDGTFLVGGSLTVTASLQGQLQQATVQDVITNSYLQHAADIEVMCVLDLSK